MQIIVRAGSGPDWEPDRFAAEMTDRQFQAIHARLEPEAILKALPSLDRVRAGEPSSTCDRKTVRRWLRNAWNTEHVLTLSASMLEGAGGAALQWTLPQTYYAVFAQLLAFYQVAGFTQQSHAAVQRKFADLVQREEYPSPFLFHATGTIAQMRFHHLEPNEEAPSTLHLDLTDAGSVDRQLCQLLSSTRTHALEARKPQLNLKTERGKPRKSFREEHWRLVAEKQGPTTLLCFLYRKRIKANYRDIDTFTAQGFDPSGTSASLERIVTACATVHEAFIAAALGADWYEEAATSYLRTAKSEALSRRVPVVLQAVSRPRAA